MGGGYVHARSTGRPCAIAADYWEDWASDVAKIAQTHITRIKAILTEPGTPAHAADLDACR